MKLRKLNWQLLVACCALSFVPLVSTAQMVVMNIPLEKDSYTDSNYPTTNFNSDTTVSVSTYTVGSSVQYRRTYVSFDLSSIPADKEIYSIRVILHRSTSISGSPEYIAKRVLTSWDENTITHNNQPTLATLSEDISEVYSSSGDSMIFNVSFPAKRSYWGLKTNLGYCIHLKNETTTNQGTTFYSRESGSLEAYLEVKYHDPLYISEAIIQHASTVSSEDGSIYPKIDGGASSSYTYEWIDGATGSVISSDTILDSLSYGWYGLNLTGSFGESIYQGFLVGVEGDTVSIDYRPDGDYTNNCYVYEGVQSGVDYKNVNFKNSIPFMARHQYISSTWVQTESYLDFSLWMDPRFEVQQADLNMSGYSHLKSNYRSNAAELLRVTSPWDERVVTYINQPNANTSIYTALSDVTTSTETKEVDISNFWDIWKINNLNNFGFKLQLQDTVTNYQVVHSYHSPSSTSSNKRPLVEFVLSLAPVYVTSEWDEESETGTVTVDVTKLNDTFPPYHYFLAYESIPELTDVFAFMRDSINWDVDSVDFFNTGTTDLSYEFSDLPAGNYYIAVFNSQGERILDEQYHMQGEFNFSEATDMESEYTHIWNLSEGNAQGELELFLVPHEEGQAPELNAVFLASGSGYFGYAADSIDVESHENLLYGFYFDEDSVHTIYDGALSSGANAYSPNDELRLIAGDSSLFYYLNGTLLRTEDLPGETYVLRAASGMASGQEIILKHQYLSSKNIKIKTTDVLLGSCGSSFGSVTLTLSTPAGFQLGDLELSLSGNTISPSQVNGQSYVFDNLIPGEYQVQMTYTISGGSQQTYPPFIVVVYSSMEWTAMYNSEYEPSDESLIKSTTASNFFAAARDNHKLHPTSSVVYFELKTPLPNGIGWAWTNWSDQIYSATNISPEEGIVIIKYQGYRCAYKVLNGVPEQPGILISPLLNRFKTKYTVSTGQSLQGGVGNIWLTLVSPFTLSSPVDHYNTLIGIYGGYGIKNVMTNMPCEVLDIYAKVDRDLRGVKYKVRVNKVFFYMEEEYVNASGDLHYTVYPSTDRVNPVMDGNLTADQVDIQHSYGDNRYQLDVSSLTNGAYLLEVQNEKAEKFYLRFIK